MNRIIIIGNGFDLAHNLKTGYKDFINAYWDSVTNRIFPQYWRCLKETWGGENHPRSYEDGFMKLEIKHDETENIIENAHTQDNNSFAKLCQLIYEYNSSKKAGETVCIIFKNKFLGHISSQYSLLNWVDIENEYYCELKKLLLEEDLKKRSESVCNLNKEFEAVKNLLEKYLGRITEDTNIEKQQSIQDAFSSFIEIDEIATYKQTEFVNSIFSDMARINDWDFKNDQERSHEYDICNTEDEKRMFFIQKNIEKDYFKKNYLNPNTLILNFNYTKTAEKLYADNNGHEIINIHGELNNKSNPIVFGYGDELDDDYKRIEKLQNNDFLENIKSIKYHKTANYRNLLKFIALGPYQAFVMGHSCGNSDRTLLNTLFEHTNCISIKVFYHQIKKGSNSNEQCSDNYIDLIKNISRNFNNKPNMRDIVVSWEKCSPLVFA